MNNIKNIMMLSTLGLFCITHGSQPPKKPIIRKKTQKKTLQTAQPQRRTTRSAQPKKTVTRTRQQVSAQRKPPVQKTAVARSRTQAQTQARRIAAGKMIMRRKIGAKEQNIADIAEKTTSTYIKPGVAGQIIVYKTQDNNQFNALDESDRQNYVGSNKNIDSDHAIFNVLVRYQWPTNMIYADTFSREEKNALFSTNGNPESFIRDKIQQRYPTENYDVMSIPYTIYQLFVINYYLTHLDNPILKHMDNDLYAFFTRFQTSEDANGSYVHLSAKNDFFNASKAVYNSPYVSQGHFMCNCAFGVYYKTHMKLTWQQIAADLISQIITNYPKYKKDIPFHSKFAQGFNLSRLQRELQGKNLASQGIVSSLLQCEENAHKNNKAILMRAVGLFKQHIEVNGKKENIDILDSSLKFASADDLRKKYTTGDLWSRGNSYGLYPFTGAFYCIYDMPYFYTITSLKEDPKGNLHQKPTEDNYFYALLIDKLSYVNGGEESRLFLIPPFSAFTQLWGHDSLYHALSHLAQDPIPQTTEPWYVEGFEPILDPYNTLWIQMDPLTFASKLSSFVSNNAILLKVKKGLNVQNEQIRLRKNLGLASKFYNTVHNEQSTTMYLPETHPIFTQ